MMLNVLIMHQAQILPFTKNLDHLLLRSRI